VNSYYRAVRPRYSASVVVMALYLGLGECPARIHAQASPDGKNVSAPAVWPRLETGWQVSLPGLPSDAGVMDDERVYIPIVGGALVALDRRTGAVAWTRNVRALWPPVLHARALLVAAPDGVHVLDSSTGRPMRDGRPGDAQPPLVIQVEATGPMTIARDLLLVPTHDDAIVAARLPDGQVSWRVSTESAPRATAVGGGAGFVALADSRVAAISLLDGHVLWMQHPTGTLSQVVTTRDRLYVSTTGRTLYALDPRDGNLAWKRTIGGDIAGAVADDDAVYVVSLDNVVRAFNSGNGNQRWDQIMDARPLARPQLRDGLLLVDSAGPSLTAYRVATGAVAGTFSASGEIERAILEGPPLMAPGHDDHPIVVVLVTRDGRAAGLRAADTTPAPLTSN
jgi:outer membrane protein assembly factor BamB